ncbi:hypothetical protein Asp14428_57160 [Actinoplanes sp. NBRC 14428]|nr:hypothetical protein Asp14428_57160 [Actinoplanes sp. NBRC 14428]
MNLSLTTIIITTWSAFAVTGIFAAVLYRRGRTRQAAHPRPVRLSPRTPRPDPAALENAHRLWLDGLTGANVDELSDTGRHHLPPELMSMPTYRLGPDRVARAKVQGEN